MKLKQKLLILFLLVAITPAFIVGVVGFTKSKEILKEQAFLEEKELVDRKVEELEIFLESFISQTKLSSLYPPIQGIIRSSKTGIDPRDGSTLEQWKDRMISIFTSIEKANTDIYKIRYIDGSGNELVRVNSRKGKIYATEKENLQNKADRYYFQNTMHLTEKEVYISRLDLNKEHDKIDVPHLSVIRIATPIFSETHEHLKGIIIVTVSMSGILGKIGRTEQGSVYLTDQDGYFLFHPDKEKEFGFQLKHEHNYFKEHPVLLNTMKDVKSDSGHAFNWNPNSFSLSG